MLRKYVMCSLIYLSSLVQANDIAFKGHMNVGKPLNISMAISCDLYRDEHEARFGLYLYEHIGKKIELNGFIPHEKSIYLQEKSEGSVTGVFNLEWVEDRLKGYWTNFEERYEVSLEPTPVTILSEGPPYSTTNFTLYAVATSFYQSDLYISFDGRNMVSVGETTANCSRDYQVEMAWLEVKADGGFDVTLRKSFTGSAAYDDEIIRSFDASGMSTN